MQDTIFMPSGEARSQKNGLELYLNKWCICYVLLSMVGVFFLSMVWPSLSGNFCVAGLLSK